MKVGFGIFNWRRDERVTDRYGAFFLDDIPYSEKPNPDRVKSSLSYEALGNLVTQRVRLTCEIVEARKSEHIGDMHYGIKPSTPEVGEKIELGVGILMIANYPGERLNIVLVPGDGRDRLWMDPRVLYRLHSQTVNLDIEITTDDFHAAPVLVSREPDVGTEGRGLYIVPGPRGAN